MSGISDALDGFIAKRFNQQTLLGSYLDPIADKFLIVSSIVLLGYNGYVPIWLIIIIVSRDIAIFGAVIISWMLGTNLRIEPLIISKINTFLQIFYIVITFLVILNTPPSAGTRDNLVIKFPYFSSSLVAKLAALGR